MLEIIRRNKWNAFHFYQKTEMKQAETMLKWNAFHYIKQAEIIPKHKTSAILEFGHIKPKLTQNHANMLYCIVFHTDTSQDPNL